MKTAAASLMLASEIVKVESVYIGDEELVARPGGHFYAFGQKEVSVISSDTSKVVKTIAVETTSWGDIVYMEKGDLHYLFANDRGGHRVLVIDTDSMEVVQSVDLEDGANVVHSYGVHWRDEFWSHSDGKAYFDTIHIDEPGSLYDTKVDAHESVGTGHGKLCFHPSLENRAFVTTVVEPVVLEIDLETRQKVQTFTFDEATNHDCGGTHSIAYSHVNRHVYAQCSGGSHGLIEIDTETNTIVNKLVWENNGVPAPYNSPDDEFLLMVDKSNSLIHTLQAKDGGATKVYETVRMPDLKPAGATFIPKAGKKGSALLRDYWVVAALTENRRQNDLCLNGTKLDPVYDGNSGFAYYDLADVVDGNAPNVQKLEVGSVDQGVSYNDPCMPGRTYRPQKRGGMKVATVVHHPNPGVGIADFSGAAPSHTTVATSTKPSRVAYAPPPLPDDSTTSPASTLMASAAYLLAGIVGAMLF